MITYQVEMWSFSGMGKIREVKVPNEKLKACNGSEEELELVFKYGQNEIQNVEGCHSVSVDDIVRIYEGDVTFWKVENCGFSKLCTHTEYHTHIRACLHRAALTLKGR